jgi:hypothetical protein
MTISREASLRRRPVVARCWCSSEQGRHPAPLTDDDRQLGRGPEPSVVVAFCLLEP